MLQYNRIDISERTDNNKISDSKECMLCPYWYFKNVDYKFQSYVCNGYHSASMMAYELRNIAILNAKCVDYWCILWGISKNYAVDGLNNSVLENKDVF